MKVRQWIRNFLRRTGAFILVTLLALVSLSFIAHIPAVQKFGIHHITQILSNISGTRVTVDKFSFDFFSSLEFESLFVEAPGTVNDTLLYAKRVDVKFANLVTLTSGRLNLRSIALDGLDLEFSRSDTSAVSDLRTMIDRFGSEKSAAEDEPDSGGRGLRIRAGTLVGTDLHVRYYDDHKNTIQNYTLDQARFDFKKISLDSNIIRLQSADVNGLTVSIRQWAQPDVIDDRVDSTETKPLRLEIGDFVIGESKVRIINESKGDTSLHGGMNYSNLKVDSIQIHVQDFKMEQLNFEGVVKEMSFVEHAGFELTSLKADYASVSDTGVVLNGLDMLTSASHLTDTLRLEYSQYADFKDFVNSVYIFGHFDNSELAINDLLTIVPKLRNSAFFAHNEDKTLRFSGELSGNVNRLRASDLSGRLGDLVIEGDFRSRNLTVKGEQFLNLRLNRAVTSIPILRDVLPNFNLPSQYNSLGTIVFSGRFDGFFNDFVADGEVSSDLGSASLDMRLDITKGVQAAEYSGGIGLDSFNIGTWSENSNLGRVTASAQIIKGRGLTSETANAEIQGGVSSLEFRGYTYKNAVLNGQLDENYFSGVLEIVDENIDLKFNGTVDMRGENPEFDFLTTIDSVDLLALNILKDTFFLSGEFEVAGIMTPSRGIDGIATASNVHIERGLREVYELDTIGLISQPDGDINHYRITSDYINGQVDGDFQLASVIPQFKRYIGTYYPALFDSLRNVEDSLRSDPVELQYDVTLSKPEAWSGIFKIKDLSFEQLTLKGELDFLNDSLTVHVASPRLSQGTLASQALNVNVVVNQGIFDVVVTSDSFFIGSLDIQGVSLSANGNDKEMNWDMGLETLLDTMTLDLGGTFAYDSSGNYAINIAHKEALFFDPAWDLHLGNRIAWGPGFIEIDSFFLRNGEHFIEVADINRRGILLDVENFDLSYLNDIWEYDKLTFDGIYSLDLRVEDIYKRNQINLLFDMDQLVINEDSFGVFSTKVTTKGAGDPLIVNSSLGDIESPILKLEGYFDPVAAQGFDVDLKATLGDFPGWFLEYFLNNSISNTKGTVSGEISLQGDTTALKLRGSAWARGAATTVNVTGVRYRLNDFEVTLTNDYIDLSNAVIADMKSNTAEVSGGLRHNMMKDMELDLRVQSPRITGIDLPKSDDVVFYGAGIGAVDVRFTGLTRDPELLINATTGQGTRIYMPLDESGSIDEESFLRFIQRDSLGNVVTRTRTIDRSGINLEVNLTVTDDAQVDLIFNEYTRDILRGVSEGDIQINLNRAGDMTLYGEVEVVSGNYLFTSTGVNKPFNIRPGGTIVWNGDPYEAELNIVADYAGLRTSVSTLIEEYLLNASLNAQQEARQLTKVQLELILTGPLSAPEINFDIKFPDVTGELSGYLDNKMKTLQADPNALNQQAFGLILLGQFIPSNDVAGVNSSSLAGVGIANTLSEFISSQLSYYISEFLQGAIEDVGFISGIDFDVGYNQSYDFITQNAAVTEWEVHMRNRLFNDRFVVDVGGSYVTDNPWRSETYFAGDYALEYALTEDRRLKVRLYYRNDETIEGRKNKTGIGLSYRREFDNFGDWLKGLERDAKKMAQDGSREGEQNDPD